MDLAEEGSLPFLDIEVMRVGTEVTIALSGELDVSTAPLLRDQFHLLIASGTRNFSCRIAGLSYIDSSGLSVLLMIHKRLERIGGTLILESPIRSVHRLFEITGVDDYLCIRSTGATEITG